MAGRFGGRTLETPAGRSVRPTADRVKEALFASLAPLLPGAQVVDCFAGTGALGIEALSRGAARAVFVERDFETTLLILKNLRRLGIGEEEATVLRADAHDPQAWAGRALPADIVLADPPYAPDAGNRFLAGLAGVAALREEGRVVIEHAVRSEPLHPAFALLWRRRYGDTAVSVFARSEAQRV